MTIRDPELQRVYQRNFESVDEQDEERRQLCGLFAAYDWFGRLEGEDSCRVTEARELLLSEEMRPALRSWYRLFGDNMNSAAIELRERFSELAGERFG